MKPRIPVRREWMGARTARSLMGDVVRDGYGWTHAPSVGRTILDSPWVGLEALLGTRPARYEARRIAAVPGGTYIVERSSEAELHTDGRPGMYPDLVIWVVVRQAKRGGETLLLDTWKVLRELARSDRPLYRSLFAKQRTHLFSPVHFAGRTFELREGSLVHFQAPMRSPTDPVGVRWDAAVAAKRPVQFRLEKGDVLVNHNHRVLHGRTAFSGGSREYIRYFVWLTEPLPVPADLMREARPHAGAAGLADAAQSEADRRLGAALELYSLTRGTPSTDELAQRLGVDMHEAERWLQRVLEAGRAALR